MYQRTGWTGLDILAVLCSLIASSEQGKKPMKREEESLVREGRILGRKGQDKRKERGLGASVVGGSSMEPSRDKGQVRPEEGTGSNRPGQRQLDPPTETHPAAEVPP